MRSGLPKEVSWRWRKSAEKWWVEQRINVANVPLQERGPGMERNLPRSQGLSYAPEEGKTREPGNKEWAWGAKEVHLTYIHLQLPLKTSLKARAKKES